MPTDLMQGWSNFFVAELGAAAALTGLLFVAVSINLSRILQFAHLPARAAEALLTLLAVLFVPTFALVPGQSLRAFGIETGAIGSALWAVLTVFLIRGRKFDRKYVGFFARVLVNQLPMLPFMVSGALSIRGRSCGVSWIVPGGCCPSLPASSEPGCCG